MNKICTLIKQSKKLIELGIDIKTADMFWLTTDKPRLHVLTEDLEKYSRWDCTPAWSLSALLEFLKPYGYSLSTAQSNKNIITVGNKTLCFYDTPIDAAFEMVCCLLENGKI